MELCLLLCGKFYADLLQVAKLCTADHVNIWSIRCRSEQTPGSETAQHSWKADSLEHNMWKLV